MPSKKCVLARPIPQLTDEEPAEAGDDVQPSLTDPVGDVSAVPKEAPDEFGATLRADGEEGGIVVVELASDGAATAAGLQTGDVIQRVGGITIGTVDTLNSITNSLDNGVVVAFEVSRDGKDIKKDVQFGTYRVETPLESAAIPTTTSPIPVPADSLPDVGMTLPKAVPSPSLELEPAPIEMKAVSTTLSNSNNKSALGLRSVVRPTPAGRPTLAPIVSVPPTEVAVPSSELLDLRPKKAKTTEAAVGASEAKKPSVPKIDDSLQKLLDLDLSSTE